MPKPGGGTRRLTLLDPADDAAYRAAVTPLVGRIERSLGPEVLSIRATSTGNGWGLAPWRPARAIRDATLSAAIAGAPRGTRFVVTDVRDCYASIGPRMLAALLGPPATAVVRLLLRLGEEGVRGLPIGPSASAVLANAALAPLDGALRAAGVRHVRWVDDLVAWGPRGDVLRAMASLRAEAASVGLELHDAKTIVLDAPEDVRSIVRSGPPSMPIRARTTDIIAAS
jgi:hypothetical protein